MRTTQRFACAALLGLALAGTGCAATYYQPRGGVYESPRVDRRAYDRGFQEGIESGRDDARHGRRFDYARHGEYRSADHGYDRGFGPREAYRDQFRRGFIEGYNNAYRGNGRY